jgi:hypothetical protein
VNLSQKFRINLTFENHEMYFSSSHINRIQDFRNKQNKPNNITEILSPFPPILGSRQEYSLYPVIFKAAYEACSVK